MCSKFATVACKCVPSCDFACHGVRSRQIFILPGRPTFSRSGEDRVFVVVCFRL